MSKEKELQFELPKKEDAQQRTDRLYADIAKLTIADLKCICDEAQLMMADAMEGHRNRTPNDYHKWEEIFGVMENELHRRIEKIFE